MKRILSGAAGVSLFYLACFILLSWPSFILIRTHVLTDTGDGLQNLWNLWWVNEALTRLHQSPWHTTYLHYPYGTSLVAHTLNPWNGFLAIPLLKYFSLMQTYNLILIFSFVATGAGTFLLAREVTGAWAGSLLAGFIVTFSNFHFAHAEGHLQLVAFEGVPFFLWSWLILLRRRRVIDALSAACFLTIVILCDYYYFIYCVIAGALLTLSSSARKKPSGAEPLWCCLSFFGLFSILFCGPLILSLWNLSRQGLTAGAHPSIIFSMDLLSPFIPGGHWRYAALTQPLWSRWTGNIHETSLYVGWSVLGLAAVGVKYQKHFRDAWLAAALLFFILALGPRLHIGGHIFRAIPLPYAWLEHLIPVLKISGCPIRMAVMVILAAAIFAARGFDTLWKSGRGSRRLSVLLIMILIVEYLPRPLPAYRLELPGYVRALSHTTDHEGVIDTASTATFALYYQTQHGHPLALGYISRVPKSVWDQDQNLIRLYQLKDFAALNKRYHLRYIIWSRAQASLLQSLRLPVFYQDAETVIVEIGA